jgi:hypothetical protein
MLSVFHGTHGSLRGRKQEVLDDFDLLDDFCRYDGQHGFCDPKRESHAFHKATPSKKIHQNQKTQVHREESNELFVSVVELHIDRLVLLIDEDLVCLRKVELVESLNSDEPWRVY